MRMQEVVVVVYTAAVNVTVNRGDVSWGREWIQKRKGGLF